MISQRETNKAFRDFVSCVERNDYHGRDLNHPDTEIRRRASIFFSETAKATETCLVKLEEMGYPRAKVWDWYQGKDVDWAN